jgi:hypothetical protein
VARIVESISSEVIHAKPQNKARSARWRHRRRGHSVFHDAQPAPVDCANAAGAHAESYAEPASDADAGADSITRSDAYADSNTDAGTESQPESVPALEKLQRRARSEVAAERGLHG